MIGFSYGSQAAANVSGHSVANVASQQQPPSAPHAP